jgi:hypothetical protein
MATITFKIPVGKGRKAKTIDAQGAVIVLPVGEQKIRFALQFQEGTKKVVALTHIASGHIVSRNFNDIRIRAMIARGHHCKLNDRQAAASLLAEIIQKHGIGTVQHRLATAPIINPEA